MRKILFGTAFFCIGCAGNGKWTTFCDVKTKVDPYNCNKPIQNIEIINGIKREW
jgi:hypothetical protein